MNNLDTALSLLQIISILILAPFAAFKAWRKLDERLTEQDKRLERIEYQVYENGGKSMKDQINALVVDVAILKAIKEK
jgi:ABC-type nickel/cobalt efflux system permease component RcnA